MKSWRNFFRMRLANLNKNERNALWNVNGLFESIKFNLNKNCYNIIHCLFYTYTTHIYNVYDLVYNRENDKIELSHEYLYGCKQRAEEKYE